MKDNVQQEQVETNAKNERELAFPPDLRIYDRDNQFLYFDPATVNYLLANEHAHKALSVLRSAGTLGGTVATLAAEFGCKPDEIADKVEALILNAERSGVVCPADEEPKRVTFKNNSKVTTVYIHITDDCNFNCKYCYNRTERMASRPNTMTLETAQQVLEQAASLGANHAVITGGEPLTRKKFALGIARIATEQGLTTELLTNGALVDDETAAQIAIHFNTVALSIDGPDNVTNDNMRDKGSFRSITKAIRLLKMHPKLMVAANVVLTRHNQDKVSETFHFLIEELGVDRVLFAEYSPVGNSLVDKDLAPDYMVILESLRNLFYDLLESQGAAFVVRHFGKEEIRPRRHCGAASGEIAIGPDGEVYPCHMLMQESMRSGKISDLSLKQMYSNATPMVSVRNAHVDNLDQCDHCEVKYICAGGCRGVAMKQSGLIAGPNKLLCDYLKALSIDRLWRAATIETRLHEDVVIK